MNHAGFNGEVGGGGGGGRRRGGGGGRRRGGRWGGGGEGRWRGGEGGRRKGYTEENQGGILEDTEENRGAFAGGKSFTLLQHISDLSSRHSTSLARPVVLTS